MSTTLVNWFESQSNLEVGTEERNMNFLTAHVMFFMHNFLNVMYLLLIEGIVFGNLRKNRLLRLALCGCTIQALSCMTSIYRFNINDEYGPWAIVGVFTGNAAFAFMQSAVSIVFVATSNNRGTLWRLLIAAWFMHNTASSFVSWWFWDQFRFQLFQFTTVVGLAYQLLAMIYLLYLIKRGFVETKSMDFMVRLLIVLITVNVVWLFIGKFRSMPIFMYANTGMMYTTCVVFVKFVGELGLENQSNREGTTVEIQVEPDEEPYSDGRPGNPLDYY